MRWKQIEDEPKTVVLIFETGDEIARDNAPPVWRGPITSFGFVTKFPEG